MAPQRGKSKKKVPNTADDESLGKDKRSLRSVKDQPSRSSFLDESDVSDDRAKTSSTAENDTRTSPKVFTSSYIRSYSSKADLLRRLKDAHETLRNVDQDARPDGIEDFVGQLTDEEILNHQDKDVRLLLACCLVDILRIFAPQAPYTQAELQDIFRLVITQLRGLGNCKNEEPRFVRYFYVLESLATVKSCVIVVELDQQDAIHGGNGGDESESLLVQLFECLLSSIRDDHSSQIESHMLDIMCSCLEDCDDISQELLDVILMNLLPSYRVAGNSKPYQLAQELIRRTANRMQPVLSQFLNGAILDGNTGASELSDNIHTLIYELHKVNPGLLLYVLPNISMQLQVDELKTRQETVALLGRLFASSHADYGAQYVKNFRDFLGRFKDISKEIRLQMIQIGCIIMQRKPKLSGIIQEELRSRLHDIEWEVRRRVVNEVCDVAANDLSCVNAPLLKDVGERLKDKKLSIRKETMTGLAQVFAVHVCNFWINNFDEEINEEVMKKLGWVPAIVLKCYAFPEQELRLRVIQLLDDVLLPKQQDEEIRAKILVRIYQDLDANSKEAIRRIHLDRAVCQKALKNYLTARAESRSKSSGSSGSSKQQTDEHIHQSLATLVPLLPPTDGAISLLTERLHGWKDQKVFKYLQTVCSADVNSGDLRSARENLIKSLGTKTALGEYMKLICRRTAMATLNRTTTKELVTFSREVISSKKPSKQEKKNAMNALELIHLVAAVFPVVVDESVHEIADLLDGGESEVIEMVLKLLAITGDEVNKNKIRPRLVNMCLKGTPEQAKQAVRVLSKLCTADSSTISDLISKLVDSSSLKVDNPRLQTALSALSEIVKVFPSAMDDETTESIQSFVMTKTLGYTGQKGDKGLKKKSRRTSQNLSTESKYRILGIRFLANRLLRLKPETNAASTEHAEKVILDLFDLFFDIIANNGELPIDEGMSEPECAAIRSACAIALLKATRNPLVDRMLTPTRWHLLGWTMQDPDPAVRQQFITKIRSAATRHHYLNMKYLSYLVMAGADPEQANKKEARTTLASAIRAMRSRHEQEGLMQPPQSEAEAAKRSLFLMPEYLLPYAIHLLAHHPDFPGHGDGGSRLLILQHYLNFILDPLVSMMGAETDNVSFLLQMLDKMSECDDALDPNSTNISQLIEMAANVLRKKIKAQHNLKPFPGKIYIPESLYKRSADGKKRSSMGSKPRISTAAATPIKHPLASPSSSTAASPGVSAELSTPGSHRKQMHTFKYKSSHTPSPADGVGGSGRKRAQRASNGGNEGSSQKKPKQSSHRNLEHELDPLSPQTSTSTSLSSPKSQQPTRVLPGRRARAQQAVTEVDSDYDDEADASQDVPAHRRKDTSPGAGSRRVQESRSAVSSATGFSSPTASQRSARTEDLRSPDDMDIEPEPTKQRRRGRGEAAPKSQTAKEAEEEQVIKGKTATGVAGRKTNEKGRKSKAPEQSDEDMDIDSSDNEEPEPSPKRKTKSGHRGAKESPLASIETSRESADEGLASPKVLPQKGKKGAEVPAVTKGKFAKSDKKTSSAGAHKASQSTENDSRMKRSLRAVARDKARA